MFELLISIIIGIAIGWVIVGLWIRMGVKKMEQEMFSILQKGVALKDEHIIMMDVQKDKDIYYCYDDRDNSFVCQGKDYEEIVQSFKERFPNRIFFINDQFKKYFPEDFKQSKFAIQTEE